MSVPYLCTSVWKGGEHDFEPLAKDNIQPQKLQIHDQVSKQMKGTIAKVRAAKERQGTPGNRASSGPEAGRQEQIDRVYASREYKEYTKKVKYDRDETDYFRRYFFFLRSNTLVKDSFQLILICVWLLITTLSNHIHSQGGFNLYMQYDI